MDTEELALAQAEVLQSVGVLKATLSRVTQIEPAILQTLLQACDPDEGRRVATHVLGLSWASDPAEAAKQATGQVEANDQVATNGPQHASGSLTVEAESACSHDASSEANAGRIGANAGHVGANAGHVGANAGHAGANAGQEEARSSDVTTARTDAATPPTFTAAAAGVEGQLRSEEERRSRKNAQIDASADA